MAGRLGRIRGDLGAWKYPLLAAAIILGGAGIRIMLIRAGWPGTDSDDSTMGLMARHILFNGEHPIFFWGQAYMGTIEAYLGALMFRVFGVSLFSLKLGLVVLYAGFMAVMYLLVARIFDRRWALVSLAILSLGGSDTLYRQLNAYGGYLETLLFGAVMVVLGAWLVGTSGDAANDHLRPWAYAGWGLAAGLGIWSDPLVAPFVAVTGLALLVLCRREMRGRFGVLAGVCFILGISPWILYAARAPSLNAAKSFLRTAPQQRTTTAAMPAPPVVEVALGRILGTVVIAVPNNTGEMGLCPLSVDTAWPPDRWSAPSIRACVTIRGAWGITFLAALLAALVLELRALRLLVMVPPRKWAQAERRAAGRSIGRLAALAAPALTILLFMLSSAASSAPWQYSRYLITLLIALPVILATLWERLPISIVKARQAIIGMGAVLFIALALGTVATFSQISSQEATNARQMDLVHVLIARGDTRVYSEFWTCFRTAFLSDERIVCSVLDGQFQQLPNRYAPYDAMVRSAPHLAFVFPLNVAQASEFPTIAERQGWHYTSLTIDNEWIIYTVVNASGKP